MALIHYYKMNGNLFDSVGNFDLRTYSTPGSITYTTGKLGGATGALSLSSAGAGVQGSGSAASAFMSANSIEASAGVTDWSICFWLKMNVVSAVNDYNILKLDSSSHNAFTLDFMGKFGGIVYAGQVIAIADTNWHFIYIRKSGTTVYFSKDGGTETTRTYNPGTYSKFNSFKIGKNTAFENTDFLIDDIRIFNTTTTTGDRDAIYNSNNPAEASVSSPTAWQSPIHQHKLNGALTDTVGSVTAVASGGSYLGSGLFNASSNARRLTANGDTLQAYDASFGGTSTGGGSFTFFCWYTCGSYSGAMTAPNFICGPITHAMFSAGPSTSFNSITVSDTNGMSATSPICMYSYDDISRRLVIYGYDTSTSSVIALVEIAAVRPGGANIDGWTFNNGTGMMGPPLTVIDEVRMYEQALNGLNLLELWNGGTGTESLGTTNATATGSLPTITMSAPAGSATSVTNGTGTGALATITAFAPAASATGTAFKSAAFVTVTVQPMIFGSVNVNVFANFNGTRGYTDPLPDLSVLTFPILSYQPPYTPTHVWQFQNTLADSASGLSFEETSVPSGSISYVNTPFQNDASGTRKSLMLSLLTDTAPSTNPYKYTLLKAPYTGTVYDPVNASTLSWSASFWVNWNFEGTAGNNAVSIFQIKFLNMLFGGQRSSGSSNSSFYYTWYDSAGSGFVLKNQPTYSLTYPFPVFFAMSYDATSQWLTAYYANWDSSTGAYGNLTIMFQSTSIAPSTLRYNTNGLVSIEHWFEYYNPMSSNLNRVTIDNIQLYNKALPQMAINEIYNSGAGQALAYATLPSVSVSAIQGNFTGFIGSLPTITMSAMQGSAVVTSPNASASGSLATIVMSALQGYVSITSPNALVSGSLPTIVLTPPAGMGGLVATGNIGSIQVTSFSGYAFSGGYGDLGTISVTGLAGKGTSFPNATFGNPIYVRPFAGSALSNKSTSGSLATVTVSAMAASRSGGATTSGGLASIAVSGITATTSASAVASAGFAAANVNTSAAFGSGVGTIAVAMPSITMSAASGSASGGGTTSRPMLEVAVSFAGLVTATGTAVVSRPFVIVTMTAPSTSITASSFVSAAFVSITMSAAAGAASGGALASRALADVAVVALSGSVSGTATVSAGMATVSIVAFGMTASAGGSTAGSLPVVTVTTPAGLSIGSSTTTAAMAVVSVSALIGTGKVNVVAAGSLATISITASAGSATGSLVGMAFSPVAMAMALGSAVAVSTGTGGLQTVTMSAPAGASIGGVIGSGPGPQVYVIAPTGKAFTGSTTGGRPGSVNLYDIPVI